MVKDEMSSGFHEEESPCAPSKKKKRFHLNLRRKRKAVIKKRIQIRNRYETAHLASEIATSILFLIGSFCLFYPEVKLIGSCLFILGSIQMLVRALLRMSYLIKLKKWNYADGQDSLQGEAQTEEEAYLNRRL
ncbi:YrhK family protein [Paenibacillus sp. Marseille-Q4541]|uniref:YrhK family protein n=1 Tax=Paenibacillus sp. Marseille-Q4541 TaxID=2831522 RepID=UPI001BA5B66C|nr:YrhK family protein [Paenibacillus sp. Marseille-Q4541]